MRQSSIQKRDTFLRKKIHKKAWELTTPHTEHFFKKYELDIYCLIDMFLMLSIP